MLLRLFSNLFGYNYEVVKAQTTVSKQKIVNLGTLMLIPVSLWTISGFYIGYNLLGANIFSSLIGGIFVGGLIFAVDKSFITTPSESVNNLLKISRLIFAVIATILGSITLDLMFFGGDLEEYREQQSAKIKLEEVNNFLRTKSQEITELEKLLASQRIIKEESKKDWKNEADGKSGTGRAGIGKVANLKKSLYQNDSLTLALLENEYSFRRDSLSNEANLHAEKIASKRSDALMSKVTDLHDFILSSNLSKFFYALFFIAVFSLEIFFLITKTSTADSLFEKMLYAEELMASQRLEQMIAQRAEILRQNGLLGHRAENLRQMARSSEHIRKIG
jgi:hypothetical protein